MIDQRLLNWEKFLDEKFGQHGKIYIDFLDYLEVPCCQTKEDEIFVQDTLIRHGAIPLHELIAGKTYIGTCRNASEAVWLGDKFEYMRYKWGETYPEKINHFEDDDGYDVFVPIKVKE